MQTEYDLFIVFNLMFWYFRDIADCFVISHITGSDLPTAIMEMGNVISRVAFLNCCVIVLNFIITRLQIILQCSDSVYASSVRLALLCFPRSKKFSTFSTCLECGVIYECQKR